MTARHLGARAADAATPSGRAQRVLDLLADAGGGGMKRAAIRRELDPIAGDAMTEVLERLAGERRIERRGYTWYLTGRQPRGPVMRTCLRCGRPHLSQSPGDRMHPECRHLARREDHPYAI